MKIRKKQALESSKYKRKKKRSVQNDKTKKY